MEEATPQKEISNKLVLIIDGIISIIFGVVLAVNPTAGAALRRRYGTSRTAGDYDQ
jgi:uncharacterized membrane protein HdeD (DUF308 family)